MDRFTDKEKEKTESTDILALVYKIRYGHHLEVTRLSEMANNLKDRIAFGPDSENVSTLAAEVADYLKMCALEMNTARNNLFKKL